MKKSIYKITNKINNKCYIGQTNNVERRFSEHKRMDEKSDGTGKLLYRAMKKYGIENFIFEVIEKDIENFDEREQYWIKHYNAWGDGGYNMTAGGSTPPIHTGENNINTIHTYDQVQKVIQLLRETNMSPKEIGALTNYDDTAIIRINKGLIWHDDNLVYPIRKELTKDFNLNRALDIIYDLQYSSLTQKQIGEKYGVGRTTVTAINNGQNCRQENLSYPIRGKKGGKIVLMIDKDTEKIIKEFASAEAAAKELKCTRSAISACCSGITKTSQGYKWKYKDE